MKHHYYLGFSHCFINLFIIFFDAFQYINSESVVSATCPAKFGYFPDPSDCQGYFICTFGNAKPRKCNSGKHYKHTSQTCDNPSADNCEQDGGQANRPKYSGPLMSTAATTTPAPVQPVPAANNDNPAEDPQTSPTPIAFSIPGTFPPSPVGQGSKAVYSPASETGNNQDEQHQSFGTGNNQDVGQRQKSGTGSIKDGPRQSASQYGPSYAATNAPNQLQMSESVVKATTKKSLIWNGRPTFPPKKIVENQQPTTPFRDQDFYRQTTLKSGSQTGNGKLSGPGAKNNYLNSNADNGPQQQDQMQQPSLKTQQPLSRPGAKAKTAVPPVFAPDADSDRQPVNRNNPGSNDADDSQQAPNANQYSNSNDNRQTYQSQNFQSNDGNSDQNGGQNQQSQSWSPNQDSSNRYSQNGDNIKGDQSFLNAASQPQSQPLNQEPSQVQPKLGGNRNNLKGQQLSPVKGDNRPVNKPAIVVPTDSAMSSCDYDKCKLPNCYCGGTGIPGGLAIAEVPQMILISFDAEVNERNLPIYERIFHKNRKNPNGCNIKATFYVSHEFTNYGMVRYLYEKGHEIASHSITHGVGTGFKDEKIWETEMSGQKSFLTSFASIRPDDIKGARAPLLGPGGDDQFEALYNGGFLYDATLVTPASSKSPYWPYTLDYAVPHSCVTPPCPQRGYRGLWEVPLNPIYGLFGETCYEADRCTFGSTGDDVYKLLYSNFYDRHYSVNKAPFNLAIHADWLKYPPHREAFERFLDFAGSMQDVWVVTGSQAVAWMQQPTPVSQLNSFAPWQCSAEDAGRLPQCDTINACPLPFRERLRYFYTCSACPAEFPWRPEA